MISTQRPTGSLFGDVRCRTPSCSTSAAVPGVDPSPHSTRYSNTSSDLAPGAIERARDGAALTREELTALFAERRPEVIEDMRLAADELRARLAGDTATFVVNRNINFTNVCQVGCAFCGFGQGKRSPDAYHVEEDDFAEKIRDAVDFGVTEICMQGGIHPDYTLEHYGRWLRLAKEVAPQLHLHAYSPMEVHFMCERSGKRARGGVRVPASSAAWGPRRARRPRCCTTACGSASPRTSCRSTAGWRSSRPRTAAGLRSTVTVMFGHIEEPWELAEHMRVVRELQERTGGFTEFVPLSFIPFHTLLGRTHGIEEISREENLKHTAVFRLALGETVTNLQASWVKMGLDAATESLRWGVNDLGGTLMEESISRMAGSYHGVLLTPEQLIEAARRGGRAAGAARHALQTSSRRTDESAMVLTAPGAGREPGRWSCVTFRCRSRGPGRCSSGCAPTACAGPTCTWSRASCRTRSCRSSRAIRSWATVEAVGGGRARARARAIAWACPGSGGTDGTCPYCRGGRENLCDAPTFTGYQRDGGYAEYTVARADFVLPLPEGYPGRAGGAAAVRRADRLPGAAAGRVDGLEARPRLGLYGFGASAHIVIQVARASRVRGLRRDARRERAGTSRASWARVGGRRGRLTARWSPTARSSSRRPASGAGRAGGRAQRRGGRVRGHPHGPIPEFDYDLLWGERVCAAWRT